MFTLHSRNVIPSVLLYCNNIKWYSILFLFCNNKNGYDIRKVYTLQVTVSHYYNAS